MLRRCELDFLETMKDDSQLKLASYPRKSTHYYKAKVKKRPFRIYDLMLRKVFISSKESGIGIMDHG